MRFARDHPVKLSISTRNGTILPQTDTSVPDAADPTKQTLFTFTVTPYIRDGDYDHHLTGTMTTT